ncbi:GNAT family N-acetyltransferase [Actinomadura rubrisoli]|uniref:GNAT family N-acetyltransferase n=1 Tax=Actinomadura rubrisoli TaxID=2530368 RepID=A0A4R5A553_9ACTN|nr:GNAT family N-acetyltransferase [Actinomadura rubrisoli]TDD66150.1 GNAT family N-acetyltransferase [Actinomadura rubrisoli]
MSDSITSETVTVRRGLPSGSEERAARLYWEAFGRKLAPALGPPEKAVPFIAVHLQHDRAICALRGGRLIGVAGYQLAGRTLVGGTAGDVLRAYGKIAGLWRLALLALFTRTPAPGQLVMDGLAVSAEARGKGVGSLLLKEVVVLAAEHGCREIRLDVIDVNPRARALYERHGYRPVRTEHTPYLRDLLGFGSVTTMRRALAASERAATS